MRSITLQDPFGAIASYPEHLQGPFTLTQMQEWNELGTVFEEGTKLKEGGTVFEEDVDMNFDAFLCGF